MACNYGDKIICIDDIFSWLVQKYWGENAMYNFTKEHFKKEFSFT